ncbi:MAG: Rpn family recombination-promoting nuclease/putative transposase, partial [Thermoguttaceae bacterium]
MFSRAFLFADFVQNYVNPHFIEQIEITKIKSVPTHLFGKENDERIVDLVFECPLKHGDGSLLAVVVFEHQTGSLKEIPLKLLKYISAIWDKEKKAKKRLSVPYFIVLRTGKRPHRKPFPQLADFFPKDKTGKTFGTVPLIEYDVVDLPAWDFTKLVGKPELR